MRDDHELLIRETVATHVSPTVRVSTIEPLPLWAHERGWSGAEVRRYQVSLDGAALLTLITKTMPLNERRVVLRLSAQRHAVVPYAHTHDLTTDAPVLTCMQDVAADLALRLGPEGTSGRGHTNAVAPAVATALAAIHAANLGRHTEVVWLPTADPEGTWITGLRRDWRRQWEHALTHAVGFAQQFAAYTAPLERAADRLVQTLGDLWREGTCLTLVHGDFQGAHVLLHQGQPYLIDWGAACYGPLYLDLPGYFTPHTVRHYRRALADLGVTIPEPAFLERYAEAGRYVGFKYMGGILQQWPAQVRSLIVAVAWALEGTQPDRPFAATPNTWCWIRKRLRSSSAAIPERDPQHLAADTGE